MRPISPRPFAAVLAIGWTLGCGSSPPPPAPVVELTRSPYEQLSAERSWADLEALVAAAPRPAGSAGSTAARLYLREQLAKLEGVTVERVETRTELEGLDELVLQHVVATAAGETPDRVVLVAPYDSAHYDEFAFVGANDGASGAAVVLELFRVLSAQGLPYTLQAVFLDGEGRLGRGEASTRDLTGLGSAAFAERWDDGGLLPGVRLLVAFNRVCDADLRVARDLVSQRMHREEFWKAASRLERTGAFPAAQPFESPQASHLAFQRRGVRPIVAIVDTSFGGGDAPGIYAGTEDDVLAHCAPESLETVGLVSLEAVRTISKRLAKIDRFSRTPLAGAIEPPASRAPTEAAAPAEKLPEPAAEETLVDPTPGEAP